MQKRSEKSVLLLSSLILIGAFVFVLSLNVASASFSDWFSTITGMAVQDYCTNTTNCGLNQKCDIASGEDNGTCVLVLRDKFCVYENGTDMPEGSVCNGTDNRTGECRLGMCVVGTRSGTHGGRKSSGNCNAGWCTGGTTYFVKSYYPGMNKKNACHTVKTKKRLFGLQGTLYWLRSNCYMPIGVMPISNCDELQMLSKLPYNSFELTKDIDCSGKTFKPIANFIGILDGKGYKIKNLRFASSGTAGLFANIGPSATISNLKLEDVDVSGASYVGALVGNSAGTIKNCAILSGKVSTSTTSSVYVGGLVGYNQGVISESYSKASVNGVTHVGGLVGANGNTLENVYATGDVVGDKNVGGLVGWNINSISNSYSSGKVSGADNVGGLVGNNNGKLDKSFSGSNVILTNVKDETLRGAVIGLYSGGVLSNLSWSLDLAGTGIVKCYMKSGETVSVINMSYNVTALDASTPACNKTSKEKLYNLIEGWNSSVWVTSGTNFPELTYFAAASTGAVEIAPTTTIQLVVNPCQNAANDIACTRTDGTTGVCQAGVCITPTIVVAVDPCGDGTLSEGQDCSFGDTTGVCTSNVCTVKVTEVSVDTTGAPAGTEAPVQEVATPEETVTPEEGAVELAPQQPVVTTSSAWIWYLIVLILIVAIAIVVLYIKREWLKTTLAKLKIKKPSTPGMPGTSQFGAPSFRGFNNQMPMRRP